MNPRSGQQLTGNFRPFNLLLGNLNQEFKMMNLKKALFACFLVLPLLNISFANENDGHRPGHPRRHHRGGIHGQRAQAVYDALNVAAVVKEKPKRTLSVKKVGGLVCLKIDRKQVTNETPTLIEDTTKTRYACFLKNKRPHRRPGQRNPAVEDAESEVMADLGEDLE